MWNNGRQETEEADLYVGGCAASLFPRIMFVLTITEKRTVASQAKKMV